MKKISYYLVFIVIIGIVFASFWGYQKYFKKKGPELLYFKVEMGSIQEIVKVRGEVAAEKDFDLEFPFAGIVKTIFVKEGQTAKKGDPLIKLETRDFELEKSQLEAKLSQGEANLEKLIAGPTENDINILKTAKANAEETLNDAETNLKDVQAAAVNNLNQSYEDALNVLDDSYLEAYNSLNDSDLIQRTYFNGNDQEGLKVKGNRDKIKNAVSKIKIRLDAVKNGVDYKDIDEALLEFKSSLNEIYDALSVIREQTETAVYRDSVSSTDKASLDTRKTNINAALSNIINSQQIISSAKLTNEANINAAEAKVDLAKGKVQSAKDALTLKMAGARSEDIKIAESKIQEIKSQISIIQEKIKKSTIFAPMDGKVVKIWLEERELFRPGAPAISLFSSGYKIQADVSELEIAKIKEGAEGNNVLIELDAFPGKKFESKVAFIEPKEVIKEGDKYYRINVYLNENEAALRSGMSADLTIYISFKDNALKIPEYAVYEKGSGKKFVKILENKKQKEVEVKTGISDGESIEIIEGLQEGQTVIVSG